MGDKFMFDCDLCGRSFQFGPHLYDGKFIARYQVHVCMGCYRGNWDGWEPHREERIVAIAKEKGIKLPPRNEKGWLPHD